ncbi:peptidase inhibitor family I36 protein [Streptomyces bambusae]|uniref:peptidase inhibitor family I36 protein n=1 Tax=Streptomyces bambusae TaxID=1550616 RepID=UPI001CFEC0DE|nr:peptidase inhibitor family I36 protein [Streptomyces bambusae]MCB5164465.1 peptidase inhibitor family I36 protein [Streptomyces bambusae]
MSRMRRSLTAFAVGAALGAGALAVTPAAAAAPRDCPDRALCAYWLKDYKSTPAHPRQKVFENNRDLSRYANFNHSAGGSLFNNGRRCHVKVYKEKNYRGRGWQLNRGTGWREIGAWNLPHIWSNKWC